MLKNNHCSNVGMELVVSHALAAALFTRAILDASPPISSKTIKRFFDGLNHARGTWYLKTLKDVRPSLFFRFPIVHGGGFEKVHTIFELDGRNQIGTL